MELRDLDTRGGEWLRGDGAQGDVVISSRVRLARNLAGFSFLSRASEADRREIIDTLHGPLMSLGLTSRAFWMDLEDADRLDTRILVERHLISRELESSRGPRGVCFGSDEVVSAMVNEEDHLRL